MILCRVQLSNKRRPQISSHLRREELNKCCGAYLSKCDMLINDRPIFEYFLLK